MNQFGSSRRRFLLGLVLGLTLGVGTEYFLLKEARLSGSREAARQTAIVTVQSLAEIVHRAGASGGEIATAVAEFARKHPDVRNIRVVRGTRLEASTVPADTGAKAAPRRLSRDEKTIYDQGQHLRAAVQTNRDEGVSRKEEIEIAAGPSGVLVLSTPIEEDSLVTGYAQIEVPARGSLPTAGWIAPSLAVAAAVLLFLLLSTWAGERRTALAVLSTILLVGVLFGYGRYGLRTLESDRKAMAAGTAKQMQQESEMASAALQALSVRIDPPLQPSRWDVDIFRRPLGLISDTGAINEEKIRASLKTIAGDLNRATILIAAVSFVVMAFFGFGFASRLLATVIEHRQAYVYTVPAMIGMIVLVFFPFLYGITLSFTGSTLYNSDKPITEIWTGLQNYKDIITDVSLVKRVQDGFVVNYSNFYWTLLFTIFWTVSNVSIGVTIGLILALMLNTKGLALRPIYRVLLIFPWAMPNYITALIWKGMFHQQFGVVNQVIQIFGGQAISWFEKPATSYLTVLATNGWLSFPFMMVISLGALQSIPAEQYEAARVDGATRWQQFRSITLPSLKPSLIPAIILSVVWTFNMFNIIYLVTQGEPAGSTEILITQAYKIAFEKYRYGYAAAYSTIIFCILLAYGIIQNRVTKATEAIAE